jgi:hypothetical protein
MLLSTVAILGGLYLFFRGFPLLARKRLLLNTPTSIIRSASLGLVEISGVATGPYTLPAPISGMQCFLYCTTAWLQSDESKTHEEESRRRTLHVPFFLNDGLAVNRDWSAERPTSRPPPDLATPSSRRTQRNRLAFGRHGT